MNTRRLILTALLSAGLAAHGQTLTTLTGTIMDSTGAVVTSGVIQFKLQAPESTIPGVGRFVGSTVYCDISSAGHPVATGTTNACVITSNTAMSPAGTSYATCIQPYGVQPGGCFNFFALAGQTVDISTIAPTPTTLPLNYQVGPGVRSINSIAGPFVFTGSGFGGCSSAAGTTTCTFSGGGGGGIGYPPAGIPNSSGSAWLSSFTPPAGAIVGTTDTQTLTNKSIDASEVNSGVFAAARLPLGSSSAFGALKCDGTTTICSAGVISATGGGGGGTPFAGWPGIPYATAIGASRAATSADLATLGAIVSNPTGGQSETYTTGQIRRFNFTDWSNFSTSSALTPVGYFDNYNIDTGGSSVSAAINLFGPVAIFRNPGWNWGPVGTGGTAAWFTATGFQMETRHASAGIGDGIGNTMKCSSAGDCNGIVNSVEVSPMNVALSDEGVVPFQNNAVDKGGSFTNVVSGGSKATTVTVNAVSEDHVGAGRWVYDITSPTTNTQTIANGPLNSVLATFTGGAVAASTCGVLAGSAPINITAYMVDSFGTATVTTATPPPVNTYVTVSGFPTATYLNGTWYVTAVTGTSFSYGVSHAAVGPTTESAIYISPSVNTPRQAGIGTVAMTFGVTLAGAYTMPSPAPLFAAWGDGFFTVRRLVSVGSYTGGVQYVTANLSKPILANSRVCFGGLAGKGIKNTSAGEFYAYIGGTPTTTTAYELSITAGRVGSFGIAAGAVTIVDGAEIEAINYSSPSTFYLGDNNMASAPGDLYSIPEAMVPLYALQNNSVTNANPNALIDGIDLHWGGTTSSNETRAFSSYGPESNLVSQGGTGHSPTGLLLTGRHGQGLRMLNPPGDGYASGNLEAPSIIYVDCINGLTYCNSTFQIFYDHNPVQATPNDSYLEFNALTNTYNFGGSATPAVLQANTVPVCLQNGTGCPTSTGVITSGANYALPGYASAAGTTLAPNNIFTDSTRSLLGVNVAPTHGLDVSVNSSTTTGTTSTQPAELEIWNTNGGVNTSECVGMKSNNSTPAGVTMGKTCTVNVSITAGAESGDTYWMARNAGTLTPYMVLSHDGGLYSVGVTGGSKGSGSANFTSLYVGGVAVGSSSGTVSSFSAGNLSPLFTTSVATPTATPALSFTLTNQATNTFFAGPNGSTGAPTFRAIVAADVPTLNQSTTGQSGTVNTIAGNVTFSTGLSTTGAGTIASPYVVTATGGSSGLSGMTAGQVPIAATATTVTSSMALGGGGTTIPTFSPTISANDVVYWSGTTGLLAGAGFSRTNVTQNNVAQTLTATKTFSLMQQQTVATVASASTVAPVTPVVIFSGTTTIDTITPPTGTAALIGAEFDFESTSGLTISAAGNVATSITATANILYHCTYFGTTDGKWRCK